ncbi:MAG: UvrB/UvrC motif-containing protein [Candidatus Methylomirabilales bacterium]
MKCERCHERDEEIHLLKVAEGGSLRSLRLCHPCAEREQQGKTARLLGSGTPFFLVQFQADPAPAVDPSGDEDRCPVCGLTADGVEREEHLPCPDCPESFGHLTEEILFRLQDLPAGSVSGQGVETVYDELSRLQRRMREAVAAERFEEAAGLREAIRRLYQVLESGAG